MLRRVVVSIPAYRPSIALRSTRRFNVSTPTPTPTASACPFSGTPTTTDTATRTCPIMGTPVLPKMACPIEEDTEADIAALRAMPFKTIVSQTGKVRLSGFVTATAVVGYVMAGGTSPLVAAAVTAGTMLQSMSANTANQIIEVEHDKNMKRTCKRPLPVGAITRTGAAALCTAEFAVGTGILAAVSPLAAALGALNWAIYVCMYTPLKRVSATNTWFGSIVGGIPPWMGGAAATGSLTCAAMHPASLLAAFMLVWQIPHFMALSFHCRRDYETAGYKMLAFANPWRASFYAIFLSVIMAAICLVGPYTISMPVEGLWYYPVSIVANTTMIYKSVRFHMDPVRNCRSCFVFSYMYLGVMLLAFTVNHFQPVGTATKVVNSLLAGKESEKEIASVAASS